MIEGIGEVTGAQMVRADQQALIGGQDNALREMVRTAVQRPVEESCDSQKQKASAEKKETTESGYSLDHKFPVFEKYNEDGTLILQVPSVHEDKA